MTPMRRLLILFLCVTSPVWAEAGDSPLAGHASPFLSMHADDLVQWRTWDDAVLRQAQAEGKLILLVSGFFSCAWCHVAKDESFRNAQIAEFINEHFVPVIVDRHLAPGLDDYLQRFVRKVRGAAGWPLHVFLTPQGHPLAGTVYLRPEEFFSYLQRLQAEWDERRQELSALAARAAAQSGHRPRARRSMGGDEVRSMIEAFTDAALDRADELEGGFGGSAKFPRIPQLVALLDRSRGETDGRVARFLELTLDRMAEGALHDHLSGGFFRYAAEPSWEDPQFEKMLYVNAQLAALYLRAAGPLERPEYRQVGTETLDFLVTRMRHPDGGFIAALAAVDTTGQEGGYYLWPPTALEQALDAEELKLARATWGLDDPEGQLETDRLPIPRRRLASLAEEFGTTPAELAVRLEGARRKLMAAREDRLLPSNDMRIAAWNGLMLSALAEGASAGSRYQEEGQALYGVIRDFFWDGTRLARVRGSQGEVLAEATLADHAYVAQGLLDWSEAVNEPGAVDLARRISESAWAMFWSEAWLPTPRPALPGQASALLIADGPMPSPAAVLAAVSLRVTRDMPESPLRQQAVAALSADPAGLSESPFEHASYFPALSSAHP